jgi:hypothetical protein
MMTLAETGAAARSATAHGSGAAVTRPQRVPSRGALDGQTEQNIHI